MPEPPTTPLLRALRGRPWILPLGTGILAAGVALGLRCLPATGGRTLAMGIALGVAASAFASLAFRALARRRGTAMPGGREERYDYLSTAYLRGTFRDASSHRQAKAQLKEVLDTLERSIREEVARNLEQERLLVHQSRLAAMGEMIGHIAHQWRQPLNTLGMILSNIKDARKWGDLTDDYLDESLVRCGALIQKMSSTINDFRDFFRPDKESVDFPVRKQAQDAIHLVDASLGHHRIAVSLEAEEELWVHGLPNEYSQVLLNLLTNARDAIIEKGLPNGQIRVRIERDGPWCRLRVSNNGGSIPVAPLERIFEPYFTTKPGGTGLGLYMSRMILEKSMGGSIQVRCYSEVAEFSVAVPLSEATHDH